MTTIIISEDRKRNGGKVQVLGNYEGPDDRFTFGVRSFEDQAAAERYAAWMMEKHQADHLQRVAG